MRIHDILVNALLRVGRLQQSAASAGRDEEVELWHYMRELLIFLSTTGKVYRFEDYLKSLDPARTSFVSAAFAACKDAESSRVMALLLHTLQQTTEPEQKQLILVLIDLLNFIAETRQYDELNEHRETYYADPPPAIARFDTREQAEAWLKGLAEPPGGTHILIGDEYYHVWYSREEGVRELLHDHQIEPILEQFAAKGLPAAVASFSTREEAEEWLRNHPASPMDFVVIAGEHHLAVHHKKLACHTLHPLSRLEEWEEKKRKSREEEHDAAEETSSSED